MIAYLDSWWWLYYINYVVDGLVDASGGSEIRHPKMQRCPKLCCWFSRALQDVAARRDVNLMLIIELDDGKILAGSPIKFDGKNPWVSG